MIHKDIIDKEDEMAPYSKDELLAVYGRRAKRYDLSASMFPLIGFRESGYRREAIDKLNLKTGDTVVDLCCGTGRNFRYIREYIGSSGCIIGVDMSKEMLAQAHNRIEKNNWENVDLVHSDVATFSFPQKTAAILSTYAITLSPAFEYIIYAGARSLRDAGRFAIVDFKIPDRWTSMFTRQMVWMASPYGVTLDLGVRHPWESLRKYLYEVSFDLRYGGFVYIAVGERHQEKISGAPLV